MDGITDESRGRARGLLEKMLSKGAILESDLAPLVRTIGLGTVGAISAEAAIGVFELAPVLEDTFGQWHAVVVVGGITLATGLAVYLFEKMDEAKAKKVRDSLGPSSFLIG